MARAEGELQVPMPVLALGEDLARGDIQRRGSPLQKHPEAGAKRGTFSARIRAKRQAGAARPAFRAASRIAACSGT